MSLLRPSKPRRVIFRDRLGRFVKAADRFDAKVVKVQAFRKEKGKTKLRTIATGERAHSKQMLDLLTVAERRALPEAIQPVQDYTSKAKYKAWDIANKIDRTPGIRRQLLKFEVQVRDGKRLRKFQFYHKIKGNKPSSYRIFQRINEELGFMGMYLYKRAGDKILADRRGRQVRLVGVRMSKVV